MGARGIRVVGGIGEQVIYYAISRISIFPFLTQDFPSLKSTQNTDSYEISRTELQTVD